MKLIAWPPAVAFKVDSLPLSMAGCAIGPLVLIRTKRWDDASLLAHELVHVRQWYRTFGLFPLLYLLSDRYRLRVEIEAYRVQLALKPAGEREAFLDSAAWTLARRYYIDGANASTIAALLEHA